MSNHLSQDLKKYQEPHPSVNGDFSWLLHALLRKMSDGILWIDLEGTIRLASLAIEKILDLSTSQLLDQRYSEIFADDFFGFSMQEALRFGISYELLYKSQGKKELEISTSFLFEGPKHLHGLLLKVSDASERKKNRDLETRSNRMAQLGEMAAHLAHEIRNPLGSIRGFSTLLFRDLAGAAHLQEMVGHVLEGTKALERLVTAVLEYARPVPCALQTSDLSAFLRQTARFAKIDIPGNIRFSLHIPNSPLLAPFDPDALKRALLNLLANAVQSMPSGGEISLSLLQVGSRAQITVSDTGVGMDEKQLSSLFIPFFTTKKTGNGFGLVETKKIAAAHGGAIEVHSMPNKGSSFTILLPLRIG